MSSFYPKVSIVMPLYNQEKFIKQCLLSVMNQSLKDIEIIVVNDGSTDNSLKIVSQLATKDKRIIILNNSNFGYGHAVNSGISIARGQYIGIVETDDFVDKFMFEDLYNATNEGNIDIVKSNFFNCYDVGFKKNKIRKCPSLGLFLPKSAIGKPFNVSQFPCILKGHPSIWSAIYNKNFLLKNKIKFNELKGAGWVDNPFFFETMLSAKQIIYLDRPYYCYRKNNANSSTNKMIDFNMPINRMIDIINIANKYKICDEKSWFYIYERALSYIEIVFEQSDYDKNYINIDNKICQLLLKLNPVFFNKYFFFSRSFLNHKHTKQTEEILLLFSCKRKKRFRHCFIKFVAKILFPDGSIRRKLLFNLIPPGSNRKRFFCNLMKPSVEK